MSRILVVDDNATTAELIGQAISSRLGHTVVVVTAVEDVTEEICTARPFALALVDLSFRRSTKSGLDVLLFLARVSPDTKLVLFTQGDDAVAELMRDAWEALPLASAVSKSLPIDRLADTIRLVLAEGSAPADPVLQPLLPATRSPWRRADQYRRLVPHAGHAKLWQALVRAGPDPSYEDLHRISGLKVNTLRNYREQLLYELELHGLSNPTMRQMQTFALRCQPLLAEHVQRALEGSRGSRIPPPPAVIPLGREPG